MRGIARLLVVAAIAVVLFLVALSSLDEAPASECQMESVPDASYRVRVEERPTATQTTYHLLVAHDDRPVAGAQVCMRADMGGRGGRPAEAASNVGREVSPGRYAVPITLDRAGPWRGTVVVVEPGRRPVQIPLELEVVS